MPVIDDIKDKQALEAVMDSFNTSSNARTIAEQKWDELYHAWRGISYKKNYQGKANIYDPELANSVIAISTRILGLLFRVSPFFDIIPKEEQDKENASIIKALLDFQLTQKAKIFQKCARVIPQLVVYGTAIMKVVWRKTVKDIRHLDGTREPIIFYDDPDIIPRDIFSVYVSPRATDIETADYIIDKYIVDESHLKSLEKAGIYTNLQDIDSLNTKGFEFDNPYVLNRYLATGINVQVDTRKTKKYELLEYWGKFDLGDGEKEYLITVLNRNRVIRLQENPFIIQEKPFVYAPFEMATDEFYGISPLERSLSLQYALNDAHNQVIDNKTSLLKPPLLVGDSAGIDVKKLEKFREGGIVRVEGDVNAIKWYQMPDMSQTGIQGVEMLRNVIQRSTGGTDPLLGVSEKGQQTATEVKQLVASGQTRIGHATRFFADMILAEIVRKAYQYDLQYMTRSKVVRIVGERGVDYKVVTPEDIVGNYDFIPLVFTELADKEARQEQLINFLEIALKAAPDKIDVVSILKRIWEGWGFSDADKIVKQELENVGGVNMSNVPNIPVGQQPIPPIPPIPPIGL